MRILVLSVLTATLGLAACGSKSAPVAADVAAPPMATAPAPTAPAPTEPTPTEPTPTEPAPTEPAPTEPDAASAPTEPDAASAPTEPDAAPAPPTPLVIYDGRPGKRVALPPVPHDAALDKLLFAAVGGDYVTDPAACGDSEEKVVLRVGGGARGAFLAPGKDQTLFLVTTEACNPVSVADAARSAHAVVVEGGAAVATLPVFGEDLVAVVDVDEDGTLDLVTTGGGTGQGYTVENLRVTRVAGGTPVITHSQEDVYSDNCGTVDDPLQMETSVVTVMPGTPPTYARERYGAPCQGGEEGAAGFRLLTE